MPDVEPATEEQIYQSRPIEPLSPEQVKGIVEYEISDAIGGLGEGSSISEQRRLALRYYYGRPFGNEIEGRSQVILTDVADTIEWIMPTLMRMLCPNGKRVARLTPTRSGDQAKQSAKVATAGVNHIIMKENNGFSLLHDWFKTALLEKNGFLKTYYEEKLEPNRTAYRGLDEMELAVLLEDEGLQVVSYDERVEPVNGVPTVFFDVVVQNRSIRGQIKVEGVPPEEFLIARRSIKLDDETAFCAHHKKMTVSDLLALGFDRDLVLQTPTDDTPEFTLSRQERFDEEETFPIGSGDRADPASREIWVTECYARIDEDGDGYSELRKVTVVGQTASVMLGDEEINHNPFSSITPVPMPFKFIGQSLADLVMDLQKIRSVLLRAMMDNLFLHNNPRTEVVEGQVNIDDLLTSRPGNIVRVRAPNMMREVETPAFSPMAMGMMEFLEGVRENRTGITRYNQGMDAESLNQTASGITQIMTAAAARVELIARIFAQTGMRDVVKQVYRCMKESPIRPFEVQLDDGAWLMVDPNVFVEDFDVEIVTGLGVGAATERIQHIQMLLELQAQVVDRGYGDYLVNAENIYNSTEELTDAMGFEMPNQFFTNPRGQKPPEPRPDPRVVVQNLRNQADTQKLEVTKISAEVDANKEAALVEHRAADLAQEYELEMHRIKVDSETRIEIAKIQADASLQVAASQAADRDAKKANGKDATA